MKLWLDDISRCQKTVFLSLLHCPDVTIASLGMKEESSCPTTVKWNRDSNMQVLNGLKTAEKTKHLREVFIENRWRSKMCVELTLGWFLTANRTKMRFTFVLCKKSIKILNSSIHRIQNCYIFYYCFVAERPFRIPVVGHVDSTSPPLPLPNYELTTWTRDHWIPTWVGAQPPRW